MTRIAAGYVAAGACAPSTGGAGAGRDGRAVPYPSLSESRERSESRRCREGLRESGERLG